MYEPRGERLRIIQELYLLVQQKDSQGDTIASEVLLWAILRLMENWAHTKENPPFDG